MTDQSIQLGRGPGLWWLIRKVNGAYDPTINIIVLGNGRRVRFWLGEAPLLYFSCSFWAGFGCGVLRGWISRVASCKSEVGPLSSQGTLMIDC